MSKQEIKPKSSNFRLSKYAFISLFFLICGGGLLFAQQKDVDSLPHWEHERKLGVLLNQSNYDNWLAGGTKNFSGTINLDYRLNFNGENWKWISTLDMALGYAKTDDEAQAQKTEDQLEINAIVERKTSSRWNFSSTFNLKTQNAPGYAMVELNDTIERQRTSSFFSPAYLRLGIGISYTKDERFAFQFNPLTARLILVDRSFTQNLAQGKQYFGVDPDKIARWEAGVALAIQSKIEIAKNIFFYNRLSLVTNYLEELKNIDLDYTAKFDMRVNKYLSTIFETQFLYDDNALADLQVRQVFGLSVALPF